MLTLSFSEFITGYISYWCFGFDFEEEWETEFVGWVGSERWAGEGLMVKRNEVRAGGFILSNSEKWKSFFLEKYFSWKIFFWENDFPPTKHTQSDPV